MKYQVVKEGIAWYGYKWNKTYKRWDYIDETGALTKVGCKYLVNKYHKKLKQILKLSLKNLNLNKRFVLLGGGEVERLTIKKQNGDCVIKGNGCVYGWYSYGLDQGFEKDGLNKLKEVFYKLAEYETAEEEGRLLVIPCKVGDKVYQIISRYTECTPFGDTFDESSCCGCEEECDSHKTYQIVETKSYTLEDIAWNIRCGNWGKNIFTDREEAEKALERMRQSNATN